ncbi:MAG: tetratricopeptide repeat protein [Elusimicrobia bacterium]|nr:tetratricopeptide repeat protein [Elusimicrobiota bacterium]
MKFAQAAELLDGLGQAEKIEDLAGRFGLPHVPEHELEYFKNLHHPELSLCREALDKDPLYRGRLKRIMGDHRGACRDFQAALDKDPRDARARAWLGELDLGGEQGETCFSKAVETGPDQPWAYLYRGAGRLLRERPDEARADLEAFLGLRPESALGLLLLGRAEEKAGRRVRAAKAYEESLRRNPACSAAALLRCRLAEDPGEAAFYLRQAYNASPVLGFITLQIHRTSDVESPRYTRKMLAFSFSHPEKVGAYYRREATQTHFSHFPAEDYSFVERLVKTHPDLAWAQAFFGRAACYTPGGARQGVERLTRAIELAPSIGWFYAWRANARRLLGETQEALEDFALSVRLQPFYHRAYVWRGSLWRKLGRPKQALADLDRALVMDPYYSLTYYERSRSLRGLGEPAAAARDLDRAFLLDHRYHWAFKTGDAPSPAELDRAAAELGRALAADPREPSLLVWRGQLRIQQQRFSEAFEDFERASWLDPQNVLALAWHGWGWLRAGRPELARRKLMRALELSPRLWIAHGWLAEACFEAGAPAEARAVIRKVLAAKSKIPWAYHLEARMDFSQGRYRRAVEKLKTALLLDGKYPEAYLLLAQVHLAREDLKKARAAAERCLEIAPNMGRAYAVRAEICRAAGRPEKAIEDYRRLLADFPYLLNDEQCREMEARLASV